MTREDCIKEHLCGKPIRRYTITTSCFIFVLILTVFTIIKPWRYLRISTFAILQISSIAAIGLVCISHLFCVCCEKLQSLTDSLVIILSSIWFLSTICGYIDSIKEFEEAEADVDGDGDDSSIIARETTFLALSSSIGIVFFGFFCGKFFNNKCEVWKVTWNQEENRESRPNSPN